MHYLDTTTNTKINPAAFIAKHNLRENIWDIADFIYLNNMRIFLVNDKGNKLNMFELGCFNVMHGDEHGAKLPPELKAQMAPFRKAKEIDV